MRHILIPCAGLFLWALVAGPRAMADEGPSLTLTGVVRAQDGGHAIVRDAAGRTFDSKVGETVGGWKLISVEADRVTFERDSTAVVIKLTEGSVTAISPSTRLPSNTASGANIRLGPPPALPPLAASPVPDTQADVRTETQGALPSAVAVPTPFIPPPPGPQRPPGNWTTN